MAKDKERTLNPAQQQRKLEKARQLKKSRAELQARRNEKLARRNPDRIQRQIADLKALEASGDIKSREKAILEELERDLRAVLKAREALGDKAPSFASHGGSGGSQQRRQRDGSDNNRNNNILGKRRYDGERKRPESSSGSDTDESVRRIPMPEDTPPPIPREFRRDFRARHDQQEPTTPTTAKQGGGQDVHKAAAAAPVVKTTYESAPQIRDLRKEAVGRFVPSVVRKKLEAAKGGGLGRLVEPEEMDRLEAEGYAYAQAGRNAQTYSGPGAGPATGIDDARLAEEEERFLREVGMQDGNYKTTNKDDGHRGPVADASGLQIPTRHVEMEEVEDEEA
ncbi:hypothetical protein ABEF95_006273 [Exophiala dermatitidis]